MLFLTASVAPIPVETWLGAMLGSIMTNSGAATHVIAWLFYVLFFMIVLDIITGWMKGIYEGNLDSAKNHRGYIRKLVLITTATMTIALDFIVSTILYYMGMGDITVFGFYIVEVPLLSAIVLIWMMLGEVLSILENMGAMNVRLPKFIENALSRLQSDIDEGNINIRSQVRKDKEGNIVIENQMKVPKKEKENVALNRKVEIQPDEDEEDEE